MAGLTREHALWITLTLALAFGRFGALDGAPLSELEAGQAMAVWNTVRGLERFGATVENPLIGSLQGLLMFIAGPNDIAVRVPAALISMLLPLSVWFARREFGLTRSLAMALFLFLSPTVWFVSRLGHGAIAGWAIAALLMFWKNTTLMKRAVMLGLLLACGRDAIVPALSLALAVLARGHAQAVLQAALLPKFLLIVLGTAATAASGLLFLPAGFGGMSEGWAGVAKSLSTPGDLGLARLYTGLLIYELPLLMLAIISLVRLLLRREADAGWLMWIALGLFLPALPGSLPEHLVGLVIAAGVFAAQTLESWLEALRAQDQPDHAGSLILAGSASFGLCLAAMFAGMRAATLGPSAVALTFAVMVLALVGVLLLISAGTTGFAPFSAGALGVVIFGLMWMLSNGYNLAINRSNDPGEPYVGRAPSSDLHNLTSRMGLLSERATGDAGAATLVIDDRAPATVRWSARNLRDVSYSGQPRGQQLVLLPAGLDLVDTAPFVGDVFSVSKSASLSQLSCTDQTNRADCSPYTRWLIQRDLRSTLETQWVLWVRGDLAAQSSGNR